jgi:hypothetical protein
MFANLVNDILVRRKKKRKTKQNKKMKNRKDEEREIKGSIK